MENKETPKDKYDYFSNRYRNNTERVKEEMYNQNNFIERTDTYVKYKPLYFDEDKNFWIWDTKDYCWRIINDIDLINRIEAERFLRIQPPELDSNKNLIPYSKAKKDTPDLYIESSDIILKWLRYSARKNKPSISPPSIIQFKDKVIDIRTEELRNATPELFVTNAIPWVIGDSEDTPNMDKIFEEWVGTENVPILYDILAYCTLPDYPIPRFFILFGKGDNGKTIFLQLIEKFVGLKNICASDLNSILEDKFESANLFHKTVCIIEEIDKESLKSTRKLKALTGDGTISMQFKYKQSFSMKNYAKIIISTNAIPQTRDKTDGFYKRVLIIEFPNQFTGDKKISNILNTIPDIEYSNLARKSIRILKELLKRKKFTNEESIEQKQSTYEDISDPISRFVREQCYTEDTEGFISSRDFYNTLILDFKARNLSVPSMSEVGRWLTAQGYPRKTKRIKGDEPVCVILGIRLKSIKDVSS